MSVIIDDVGCIISPNMSLHFDRYAFNIHFLNSRYVLNLSAVHGPIRSVGFLHVTENTMSDLRLRLSSRGQHDGNFVLEGKRVFRYWKRDNLLNVKQINRYIYGFPLKDAPFKSRRRLPKRYLKNYGAHRGDFVWNANVGAFWRPPSAYLSRRGSFFQHIAINFRLE